MLPTLLKQTAVAKILCKSTAWLERARWAHYGPPYIKIGRSVVYDAKELEAWINEQPKFHGEQNDQTGNEN